MNQARKQERRDMTHHAKTTRNVFAAVAVTASRWQGGRGDWNSRDRFNWCHEHHF